MEWRRLGEGESAAVRGSEWVKDLGKYVINKLVLEWLVVA